MSVRILHGSLGVVCVIGLAVAGIGWHSGEHNRPSSPERVFCNIDELVKNHPAWDQLTEVKTLLAQTRQIDNVRPAVPLYDDIPAVKEPTVLSEPRSVLQARLVTRAQEEADKFGAQLTSAIDQQLNEKRQEMESKAQANEAEKRRHYEEDYAKALRIISEEQHFERVDAAIKLAAIKAQVSSGIVLTEQMKKTAEDCESTLCRLQANLVNEQSALKQRSEADLNQSTVEGRLAIERELTRLRNQESGRVSDLIRSKNERLLSEIYGDSWVRKEIIPPKCEDLTSGCIDTTKNASKKLHQANSSFMKVADSSVVELEKFKQELETRIKMELEANVRRIAKENGFEVTFTSDKGLKNKTDWFRSRLPFETGKKAGRGRTN